MTAIRMIMMAMAQIDIQVFQLLEQSLCRFNDSRDMAALAYFATNLLVPSFRLPSGVSGCAARSSLESQR